MARRVVTDMHGNKLAGYQAVWAVMMRFHKEGRSFTRRDVDLQMNVDSSTIRDHMNRFERAGFIELNAYLPPKNGGSQQKTFRMVKPMREAPRLRRDGTVVTQGLGTEYMWRSMKMLKKFTIKELQLAATTDQVQVTEQTAKDYVKHLFNAGYLKRVRRGVYVLPKSKITGPKPPMIQKVKQVFDQNLGKVMWKEPSHE